jgi:transposase
MLVELGLVEQRYQAVLEVIRDGATVTDVARRYGVTRQTVHVWSRAYAVEGLRGLADRSSRPLSCPHQMAPRTEARVVGLRREHPGWGPRTIRTWLGREGIDPVPGRTSIERCLVRHGLVTPEARKRRRSDYRRWERSRAMELWQMDIVGGVHLADGSEAKIVSGIDDHSRGVRPCGCPGDGDARVRRADLCDADPWGARRDPDGQRQGSRPGNGCTSRSVVRSRGSGSGWPAPSKRSRSRPSPQTPRRVMRSRRGG